MKIKIRRWWKISLLVIFLAAGLVSAALLFRTLKYPEIVEEQRVTYNYKQQADIDCLVEYGPNMLTKSGLVEKTESYITAYIDSMTGVFTYQFAGDRPVTYQGEYYLTAIIRGTVKEGEQVKTIWSKNYELLPRTAFQGQDKQIILEEKLPIRFKEYNSFVEKFIEETEIKCDAELDVIWTVNVSGKTNKGQLEEEVRTNLIIPLNRKYFIMAGSNSFEEKNSLQETVKYQAPLNKTKIALLGVGIAVCLAGLIFCLFFTDGTYQPDLLRKKVKKIFKEYEDRLVALGADIDITAGQIIILQDFPDIIKVADDLGKPVLYKCSADSSFLPAFYVIDEPRIYTYEVKEEKEDKNLYIEVTQGTAESV